MMFVIEGRFDVESCFVIIIIICMPPPLLKHSSHPQCGSAVVWCEATYVVTGVIAATVVVVTTVVASCPAGADRTAAIAGGLIGVMDGVMMDGNRKDVGNPPMDGVMKLEKPSGAKGKP